MFCHFLPVTESFSFMLLYPVKFTALSAPQVLEIMSVKGSSLLLTSQCFYASDVLTNYFFH